MEEKVGRAPCRLTRWVGRRLHVEQREKIQSQKTLLGVKVVKCQALRLPEMWEQLKLLNISPLLFHFYAF